MENAFTFGARLIFGFLAESLRRGFTTHPTGTSAVLSLLSFAIVNLLCVCPRQARRWYCAEPGGPGRRRERRVVCLDSTAQANREVQWN